MAILIKKREEPLLRPKMLIPGLPNSVENTLIKALARDPRNRYQTITEFAGVLERLAHGETTTLEIPKSSKPNSIWAGVVLGGLIIAAICIFTVFALRGILPAFPQSEVSASPSHFLPSTTVNPTLEQVDLTPVITTTVAPFDMIQIPAGEFIMGSADGEAEADEIPQHVIYLDSYWIDQTEVTVAKYNQCVETGYCRLNDYQSTEIPADYYTNPLYANYPAIDVNWKNASDYCSWAEKRLPTEAEWEKAARETSGQLFPWGDQPPLSNNANMCDANCLLDYANMGINDGYSSLAPVGSYPAGASPYGLMDMAGNVWEWVADWYDVNYYRNSPSNNPTGPLSGSERVVRGGGWDSKIRNLRTSNRLSHHPLNFYSGSLGFRCSTVTSTVPPQNATSTPTLGIGSTPTNETDGVVMIYVPEGEFIMGNDYDPDPKKFWGAEAPKHNVFLDAFSIYRTEVTNAMYRACVEAKACPQPTEISSRTHGDYFFNTDYDNYPVVYVTYEGAFSYCAWAGARLPTEAEWEKAARGTDGRLFPWGNDELQNYHANFCDVGCPNPEPQEIEWELDDGYKDTAPVGSFPSGISPYGALDMAGNVLEWVADWYSTDYYSVSPYDNPTGPGTGSKHPIRGGS
jgi:formylglycine-generating enzyme required for sulfatase activity